MELLEVFRTRQSIRAYSATPVEPERLTAILEAVNRAPSAGNLQPYEIYVVRSQDQRTKLTQICGDQKFIGQAPVALVFCADPQRSAQEYGARGAQLFAIQDATIACTFAMLAATDLGLTSIWVGAFDEETLRAFVGAPAGLVPVAVLSIGYPAESPEFTTRRRLEDFVHEA